MKQNYTIMRIALNTLLFGAIAVFTISCNKNNANEPEQFEYKEGDIVTNEIYVNDVLKESVELQVGRQRPKRCLKK